MKISHLLAVLAVSALVTPAAMAKGVSRPRIAQMRVHSIKRVAGRFAKGNKAARKGAKKARRQSVKRIQSTPPQA